MFNGGLICVGEVSIAIRKVYSKSPNEGWSEPCDLGLFFVSFSGGPYQNKYTKNFASFKDEAAFPRLLPAKVIVPKNSCLAAYSPEKTWETFCPPVEEWVNKLW
jgi:hypothetical protein